MAELLPFKTASEPFVRIEADGDRFVVSFDNCPKRASYKRHFTVGADAVLHGMNLALHDDLPMLLRPRLIGHVG